MDISKNFFELFALPVSFQIDPIKLSERYLDLQKTLHPDRHAHLSDRERRLSEQYTAYLNEAVTTLKAPLSRAQYLLKLQGFDTASESSVAIDPVFLMQQMELREQLEEIPDQADPFEALDELSEEVEAMLARMRVEFAERYTAQAYEAAVALVRKMQFLEKLALEVENLEDRLDD
ncbi:Fe-S protein assembly co-chaperone HscB [Pontibacterium sp.]|jgi:molecular chaperone HscB|uniref:Fe-S protein assembly co-chaperone HscB n=1 Tax=Pontibacterium sp. TaxID=2036026 RepID=UPI0035630D07